METYIGIDFGGTKLLIGEVDREGNVLCQKRYETGVLSQTEAADRLIECVKDYIVSTKFKGQPKAAGIGIVGIVDERNGIWKTMNHKENHFIPLGSMVSDILHINTVVDNDVKSAVMAELCFGQGRISKDFIYINVGTGLAAGIVTGGRLLRGAGNNAGEVGHMVMDIHSQIPCVCGRKGCAEGIASGAGLDALIRRMMPVYKTRLNLPEDGKRVPAWEVFRLADEGDELCVQVTKDITKVLSEFIMNLVRVTDPDTVILGGGMVSDGWLISKVKRELEGATTMQGVTNGLQLSVFDPGLVGLIGAAAHAMVERNGD